MSDAESGETTVVDSEGEQPHVLMNGATESDDPALQEEEKEEILKKNDRRG